MKESRVGGRVAGKGGEEEEGGGGGGGGKEEQKKKKEIGDSLNRNSVLNFNTTSHGSYLHEIRL